MATFEVHADHEAVSQRAAAWLLERLRAKPDLLVCLASGGTPTRTYELLTQACLAEPALSRSMRVVKLDEWGGLPAGHPATCEQHLRRTIIGPLHLGNRYVSFVSDPADPQAECDRVARWLADHGPLDVAVLGLGLNGHLGFNEPAAELQAHAHVAELSETSLTHAMVRDCKPTPVCGLTLGMADLLQARDILLVATGFSKRPPVGRLRDGGITTGFPASLVRLHPRATILYDSAADPASPR